MNYNYFHGLNMRWGTNGVSATVFGVYALLQTIDRENQLSQQEYANQLGNTVIWTGYNRKKIATFEYVYATSTTPDGNAPVVKPEEGTMFTVTDTVDANSDMNSTNWICESVVERRMNTDAVKVTVRAVAYPLITS